MTDLLRLTTIGAKSGKEHTATLRYLLDNDRFIVFAANAGSANNPDWYYNLMTHPQVTIEINSSIFHATATLLTGPERERLIAKRVETYPHFAGYLAKTSRTIPVIALKPIS